jgi:hypothetical protein
MNRSLALSLVALTIVMTAVSCTGGGGSDDETDVNTSPLFTAEEAEEAALAALLILEDLPAGWTAGPASPDDDNGEEAGEQNLDLPPECEAFEAEVDEPGSVAKADSDEFTSPDEDTVQSDVTVYANAGLASEAIDQVRQLVEQCGEPLHAAFESLFGEQFAEDSAEIPFEIELSDFSFDTFDFAELGDETLAVRITFGVKAAGLLDLQFALDLIGIRSGRVIGGLIYQSLSGETDPDLEDQLSRVVEQRVASADNSLK